MILRDTVVRRRAALISGGYGNQQRDWATATSVTYPAVIGPVSTSEDVVDQVRTVTRWRMFLPPSADVVATDRIEWDDGSGVKTFEVDGDVEVWKRRGRRHHLEAALLKVTQG